MTNFKNCPSLFSPKEQILQNVELYTLCSVVYNLKDAERMSFPLLDLTPMVLDGGAKYCPGPGPTS